MKKDEVKVGGLYHAKVSDKLVTVRIDSTHTHGGWHATNTATGKRIRIKSAQRLRRAVKSGAKTEVSEAPTPAVDKDEKVKATAKAKEVVVAKAATTPATESGTTESANGAGRHEKPKASKDATPLKVKASNTTTSKNPKRVSALDAAEHVLKSAGKPMRAQERIAAMAEQNLWKSPGGATPHATLYAAMMREINAKGDVSRFRKVDRGMFAFNKAGA